MKKFKHLSMDEKAILQDLLLSDLFKKRMDNLIYQK